MRNVKKILNTNGKVDPIQFRNLEWIYGAKWALSLAIEETANPEPNDVVLWRGCKKCAGFGMPGWIIVSQDNLQWEKCECWSKEKDHLPYCNNNCGRTTANFEKWTWYSLRRKGRANTIKGE